MLDTWILLIFVDLYHISKDLDNGHVFGLLGSILDVN